jgi:S-adenosylmethionine-diacylglycerol 3-amino-3-carboxypropyl transferase
MSHYARVKPDSAMDRLHHSLFNAIYSRSLVYNTCWEDPAVDRIALQLSPHDTMLVITSAGCNVLDYALAGPGRIYSVDANPRQTALLELKLAAIRSFEFEDFYAVFGDGAHPEFERLYRRELRDQLSPFAREFWDGHTGWFEPRGPRRGLYYHGLSGWVARGLTTWLDARPRLRTAMDRLLAARNLAEQSEVYDREVAPLLWGRTLNWLLDRQITMSLLGVPRPQHEEVRRQHAGGVSGFVRDAMDYVFRCLPIGDNYFWRVYVKGRYTPECCPEYLKPANFAALKAGHAERIVPLTDTVTGFLHRHDMPISKFVLLDHMDWMSAWFPELLVEEWEAILARATPGARVIFRSAHARPAYLGQIAVPRQGAGRVRLLETLRFDDALARDLQKRDRVHTYAGFHIADVVA